MSEIEISEVKSALEILTEGLESESTGFNPVPVVISIIHANATFEIPGIGNHSRLRGIFLASQRVRVFYPNHANTITNDALSEFTGGRPFCASSDYVHGDVIDKTSQEWETGNDIARILRDKIAESAGSCSTCPLGGNKAWGSVRYVGKDGQGKACTEKRRLLYWYPGIRIPIIFVVPASSVREVDRYFSSLQAGGLRHFQVMTEVTLDSIKSNGNIYSVAKFSMAKDEESGNALVSEEVMAELTGPVSEHGSQKPLFRTLVDLFNQRDIEEDEVMPESDADSDF